MSSAQAIELGFFFFSSSSLYVFLSCVSVFPRERYVVNLCVAGQKGIENVRTRGNKAGEPRAPAQSSRPMTLTWAQISTNPPRRPRLSLSRWCVRIFTTRDKTKNTMTILHQELHRFDQLLHSCLSQFLCESGLRRSSDIYRLFLWRAKPTPRRNFFQSASTPAPTTWQWHSAWWR